MPTFHLPRELADELVSEGLAQIYLPPQVRVGGAAMLDVGGAAASALIILSFSADVVALTGIKAPLQVIAQKICTWAMQSAPTDRKYALLAVSPRGQLRLDLDKEPDLKAVTALLESLFESD